MSFSKLPAMVFIGSSDNDDSSVTFELFSSSDCALHSLLPKSSVNVAFNVSSLLSVSDIGDAGECGGVSLALSTTGKDARVVDRNELFKMSVMISVSVLLLVSNEVLK
jgi:hypothetical protein